MMDKIWLIRTFDKKILGPVSKEKLLRLMRDNKLSESDEICPGNYHWIYVKEKESLSILLDAPEILGNFDKAEQSFSRRKEDQGKKKA